MVTNLCRVLWTGESEHHEFGEAMTWLREHSELTRQTDISQVSSDLTDHASPPYDLILVGQARPGQFSQAFIEQWHTVSPLTPILAVLGSWCEGEMRSGIPWKGMPRFYWHQILPSLARELQASTRRSTSTAVSPRLQGLEWRLARTVTDTERYLYAAQQPLFPEASAVPKDLERGHHTPSASWHSLDLWLIRSETQVTFETLANALRLAHGESVWWPSRSTRPLLHNVRGILWDAEQLDDVEWRHIEQHAEVFRRHSAIVLAGFLRHEEKKRLAQHGVEKVLSKPLRLEWLLQEVAGMNPIPPKRAEESPRGLG